LTRDTGRTILFSSHLLSDVERVADRIAILDRSVLRASCSVETFISRVKRLSLRFATTAPPLPPDIPGLLQARRDGHDELVLTIANPHERTEQTLQSMNAIEITEVPISL